MNKTKNEFQPNRYGSREEVQAEIDWLGAADVITPDDCYKALFDIENQTDKEWKQHLAETAEACLEQAQSLPKESLSYRLAIASYHLNRSMISKDYSEDIIAD